MDVLLEINFVVFSQLILNPAANETSVQYWGCLNDLGASCSIAVKLV